jgi:hypothetical protein
MLSIKNRLYKLCYEHIEQKIATAETLIRSAQESSKEETKSSAGDKYETGRAMLQQEIDKTQIVLSEALRLKNMLDHINPERSTGKSGVGSLVSTNNGNFFISISGGQYTIDNQVYYTLSPASPIGKLLLNVSKGDEFTFNGKKYIIEKVV